jgi:CRP-like cAMP-binding protein
MLTQSAIRNGSFKQAGTQSPGAPPAGAAAHAGTIELMGACMSFARNSEIYGENEPADYLYKIVSGTVRTYKVLVDGRRQVGAFHLPGDIFGFETGDEHTFSAEAITDCKIIVIKRSAVMALAARDNDVARQMWELTARELQRVQKHSLVLIKTAEERVAGFLLEMADRVASGGLSNSPCRVRISPTTLASRSKPYLARSSSWKTRRQSRWRGGAESCCETGPRCAGSMGRP